LILFEYFIDIRVDRGILPPHSLARRAVNLRGNSMAFSISIGGSLIEVNGLSLFIRSLGREIWWSTVDGLVISRTPQRRVDGA